uniref:Uncharacterized protein n=1 Tax=Rhizophora mucronata TaxID=61149 RepID=A0A2P2PL39_RHIMU
MKSLFRVFLRLFTWSLIC